MANIKLNNNSYPIPDSVLAGPRADFVTHLGTIAGDGLKVVVGGVEYGVDSNKVSGAVVELEAVLGGTGEEGGFPITWNTMEVVGNLSVDMNGDPFIKVSDFAPSADELAGTEMSVMGEIYQPNNIMGLGGVILAVYGESGTLVLSVVTAGECVELGITFTETGLYTLDYGSMGENIDYVIDIVNA